MTQALLKMVLPLLIKRHGENLKVRFEDARVLHVCIGHTGRH